MKTMNTNTSWGWPARLIHWVTAGIVFWTLGLGIYMTNFVADLSDRFFLTQIHKSWGFVVFALAIARVIWLAISRKRPGLPSDTPRWQKTAARTTHWVLYLMIFLMPLSGWIMSAAAPLQDLLNMDNMVFSYFALPDPWVPGVSWVEKAARLVHFWSSIILSVTLLIHIAGVLWHRFVIKDNVLQRMTTG